MLEEYMQGFASAREVNLMRIKEAKDNGRKVVGAYRYGHAAPVWIIFH